MTAEQVYDYTLEWAKEFDDELAQTLESDPDYAKRIFSIGRGGKKPRKDIATWCDVKDYIGFFYDKYFSIQQPIDEKFDKKDIVKCLEEFLESYDYSDAMDVWFEKIKNISDKNGFCSDTKEFKANPEAYKGSVADVSMFLRVAVTGKINAPDMYTVMQILGDGKVRERIRNMIESESLQSKN